MTAREETEQYIRETEARIVEQIARIRAFDASGRSHEAMVARNLLGAVTEKRDALRIRLRAIEAVERSKGLDPASVRKPAVERPPLPDAPARSRGGRTRR